MHRTSETDASVVGTFFWRTLRGLLSIGYRQWPLFAVTLFSPARQFAKSCFRDIMKIFLPGIRKLKGEGDAWVSRDSLSSLFDVIQVRAELCVEEVYSKVSSMFSFVLPEKMRNALKTAVFCF